MAPDIGGDRRAAYGRTQGEDRFGRSPARWNVMTEGWEAGLRQLRDPDGFNPAPAAHARIRPFLRKGGFPGAARHLFVRANAKWRSSTGCRSTVTP